MHAHVRARRTEGERELEFIDTLTDLLTYFITISLTHSVTITHSPHPVLASSPNAISLTCVHQTREWAFQIDGKIVCWLLA